MSDSNKYPGYIKLPDHEAVDQTIWLAFNAKSERQDHKLILKGFYLRMFADKDSLERPLEGLEISVYLRPEEWLDLADANTNATTRLGKISKGAAAPTRTNCSAALRQRLRLDNVVRSKFPGRSAP